MKDSSPIAVVPRLLNLQQMADYLGCSYWTARDWVLAGLIPVVDLPPHRRIGGRRPHFTNRTQYWHTNGVKGSKEAARIRRERFAREYVKDYNGAAAVIRAGYHPSTPKSAAVIAYRLMQHPEVQAIIQAREHQRARRIDITADKVLQETASVALSTPKDPVKHAEKLRALEILAKHFGLLKDAPPPAQWSLDPATLAKMSTEDLEKALKHADMVQTLLAGKPHG